MYKQILVPLDGSELAEHVLPHVCDLAECSGAQVVLLRVPGEPAFDYLVPDGQVIVELRHDIEDAAKIYMEQVADELRERGIRVRTRVQWGMPVYQVILEVASELGADLVALSTHGRSGIARLVIGSVADQVVRHAPLPVLLVHPEVPRVARQETRAADLCVPARCNTARCFCVQENSCSPGWLGPV